MRDFLNTILDFIGATSLTDLEFSMVKSTNETLDQSTYDDLVAVIDSRESISNTRDRLLFYFLAGGAEITALRVDKSNIFLGGEV